MLEEIIYEKKYPHIDPMDEIKQLEKESENDPPVPMRSFDEVYEKIMAETMIIPIPKRIETSVGFVETAIAISELYEMDIKITRHPSHITVNFSFDCCGGIQKFQHVFGLADEFAFFNGINGYDITISMDYYTHAVIRNGRIVAPDIDFDDL